MREGARAAPAPACELVIDEPFAAEGKHEIFEG
jgi:hypothetical protein